MNVMGWLDFILWKLSSVIFNRLELSRRKALLISPQQSNIELLPSSFQNFSWATNLNELRVSSVHASASALAAFSACLVSNPFDVLRTRIQTYEVARTKSIQKNPNSISSINTSAQTKSGRLTLTDLARTIYREEGFFRGFYKGLKPRLLIAVPGSALSLSAYELVKRWSAIEEKPDG